MHALLRAFTEEMFDRANLRRFIHALVLQSRRARGRKVMDPQPTRLLTGRLRDDNFQAHLLPSLRAPNQETDVFVIRHKSALNGEVAALSPQIAQHHPVLFRRHLVPRLGNHVFGNEPISRGRFRTVDCLHKLLRQLSRRRFREDGTWRNFGGLGQCRKRHHATQKENFTGE
jgi:hypothetical protein